MIRRTVFVGGMVVLAATGTAAAIKLSQRDAQQIEEYTGLPPQELEDQDLEQAMQDLNIQAQPMTSQDQAALAQQTGQPPAQPANTTSASSSQPDYLAQLESLADLRDRGIITDEDFEAKKKQLLGL